MFYEVKSKTVQPDGKSLKETYLVSSESVSDAENVISKELASLGSDYTIESVRESKIEEVFEGTKQYFYAAVVGFVTIDEKTGSEKRVNHKYLVPAVDFSDAYTNFKNGMQGTISDYEIVSLAETKIVDVYE